MVDLTNPISRPGPRRVDVTGFKDWFPSALKFFVRCRVQSRNVKMNQTIDAVRRVQKNPERLNKREGERKRERTGEEKRRKAQEESICGLSLIRGEKEEQK